MEAAAIALFGEPHVKSARAPGAAEDGTCEVPGCEKPSAGRLCAMHAKRKQRGTPMAQKAQERLTPFGRLLEACLDLVDCDADDDAAYGRAEARVRMAGVVYARWVGTLPPAASAPKKAVLAACSNCARRRRG